MGKGKLIIHFDGVDEHDALSYVRSVVADGRVSTSPAGPQYCYVTVAHLVNEAAEIHVAAYRYKTGTDVFHVSKRKPDAKQDKP